MIVLVLVGAGVQLVGIVLTVLGLSKTWQNRTFSAHFTRALFGLKEVERHHGRAPVSSEGLTAADGSAKFTEPADDEPWEVQLERERKRIDEAQAKADKAAAEAAAATEAVGRLDERVTTQLQGVEQRMQAWVRNEQARGVPIAAWGVILTVVGTALQTVAGVL